MSDAPALQPFEGHPVISTAIKVTKAGDGLSAALQIEPREMHIGDEVFLVLKGSISTVQFLPVAKAEGNYSRGHVFVTETATLVDGDLVEEVIAAQEEKIEADKLARQKAKEEAAGVSRIPGTEPWPSGEDDGLPETVGDIEAEAEEAGSE